MLADQTIFFDKEQILDLIKYKNIIFNKRNKVYQTYNIDILSNDILSSLDMWEIIFEYDSQYTPNFHRNGPDGKSSDLLIERKCSKIKPNKKGEFGLSDWKFHAQEKNKADRYIFGVRRADNLSMVRIYDIQSDAGLKSVHQCLENGRQKWIEKGRPNWDALVVPEKILIGFVPIEKLNIKNCVIIKI